MGDFIGSINGTYGPQIPLEIAEKIEIRTTHGFTEQEAFLFTLALQGVVLQMKEEEMNFNDLYKATVLGTKYGEYTFVEKDAMGYYMRLIILNIQKWRDESWSDLHILATYIEEFCHHYWSISDEEIVKFKVIKILNIVLKEKVTFEELYGPHWKMAYANIYDENS